MRRAFQYFALIVVILASSILGQSPCEDLARYPVRFAILGDRTGGHKEGVYEAIVKEVDLMRPDFVMTVGDHIEGYTSDTLELKKQWDEYLGIIQPIKGLMHFTPGNHDITYDGMEPTFRSRVGNPYYSFDTRGIHIVVLDNSRFENSDEFPPPQLEWLKRDLAENARACYTMVFFHKPMWYRTLGDGKPDPLHEILKSSGVDAVFSGHFHTYYSGEYDSIIYTDIGSSGAETEQNLAGFTYHFGWVTIDSGGIHVVPIAKGAVLPREVTTTEQTRLAFTAQLTGLSLVEPLPLNDELKLEKDIVSVRLTNRVPQFSYSDTLRWELPEGWSIEPAVYPFSIAGDSSIITQFTVVKSSKLNSLPALSTRLPYETGRTVRVHRSLEVMRHAQCAKAGTGIVIDGNLSESCWNAAQSLLLDNEFNPTKQDSSSFYFAYDHDNLYVAARCFESKVDSIRAALTERDAAVYTEDAVGFMIEPTTGVGLAYQIYVNPLGTIYDQRLEQQADGYWNGVTKWNGDYEVKTSRSGHQFTVELRIPLAQLSASAKSGDVWRLNFRRKQLRLNSAAAFQVPWGYDPKTYGELRFE